MIISLGNIDFAPAGGRMTLMEKIFYIREIRLLASRCDLPDLLCNSKQAGARRAGVHSCLPCLRRQGRQA